MPEEIFLQLLHEWIRQQKCETKGGDVTKEELEALRRRLKGASVSSSE